MLALGAAGLSLSPAGRAHGLGLITPPIAVAPDIVVVRSDGLRVPLATLLQGQITALQLIFTGCSQTCPLQGAVFAELQPHLAAPAWGAVQLLSVSIDPLDDPKALSAWRRRFGASNRWQAMTPTNNGIESLRKSIERATRSPQSHSTQVFFLDRRGRLVWQSEEFAPVGVLVKIIDQLLVS